MVKLLQTTYPLSRWWLDGPGNCVELFHGTDALQVSRIAQEGLQPINGRCYVSPCYQTAARYSLFGPEGGEHRLMILGKQPRIWPVDRYAVVHYSVPKDFIAAHAIYPEEEHPLFAVTGQTCRLQDRTTWLQSEDRSPAFYLHSELWFTVPVPGEFVEGYSLPFLQN